MVGTRSDDVRPTSSGVNALTVATRLARRRGKTKPLLKEMLSGRLDELAVVALDVVVETGDPLGTTLATTIENEAEQGLIERLLQHLQSDDYERSVPLREVDLVVTERAISARQLLWYEPTSEQRRELARLAFRLGNGWSDAGQNREALDATLEAVAHYRVLIRKEPNSCRNELAICLVNLSTMYSELGLLGDALESAEEAVEIFREDDITSTTMQLQEEFGRCLSLLGRRLGDNGNHLAALSHATRAVSIHRSLAKESPEYVSALALSLTNQGLHFAALGKSETSLKIFGEAVEIYRTLSNKRPDVYRSEFALTLVNLATALNDRGRGPEALDIILEALAIYSDLFAARPWAFGAEIAGGLRTLSKIQSDLGQLEMAVDAARNAVQIYRSLVAAGLSEDDPEMKSHNASPIDLAVGLSNLGAMLREVSDYSEALDAINEAIDIFRAIEYDRLQMYRHEYARSLTNQGILWQETGEPRKALQPLQQAVALLDNPNKEQIPGSMPLLVQCLNNLAVILRALGFLEEALEVCKRALSLRPSLYEITPRLEASLAKSLANQATILFDLGRYDQALALHIEALESFQELNQDGNYWPEVAIALDSAAASLSKNGDDHQAILLVEKSLSVLRQLEAIHPEAFLENLAHGLSNLSKYQQQDGRIDEALEAAQESVAVYRQLAESRTSALDPQLAISLHNLSACLEEKGKSEEAFKTSDEALRLMTPHFLVRPRALGLPMKSVFLWHIMLAEPSGYALDRDLLASIAEPLMDLFPDLRSENS